MQKERHPRELPGMFMTEMWERFGFYVMMALITLYMIATKDEGGLGFDEPEATSIFGTWYAMVYFMPFIGGMVADKVLGYRRSVIAGAVLMGLGYASLAKGGVYYLYPGLTLIVLGNGMFKPNISSMLGKLYPKGSKLKDAGYNLFYVGINAGGFGSPIAATLLHNKYGWGAAFGSAAVGMALSIVCFLVMYKRLGLVDEKRTTKQQVGNSDVGLGYMASRVLPPSLVLGLAGYYFFHDTTAAFLLACLPVAIFYAVLWMKAKPEHKGALGALLVMCVALIPFWLIYSLNATAMTFWAKNNTRRVAPVASTELLEKVGFLEYATPTYYANADTTFPRPAKEWLKVVSGTDKQVEQIKETYFNCVKKMGYNAAGPVPVTAKEYVAVYAKTSNSTPMLKPGQPHQLLNTELFQAINPALILVLTWPLLWLWETIRKKNREPSTPAKMGIGVLLAAGCMLMMWASASYSNQGAIKVGPSWLFWAYTIITVGELCLSPIGLSLVEKLSPPHITAVMMGSFFLSIAIGAKLSAYTAGFWKKVPHTTYFLALAALALIFGTIILLISRWMNKYVAQAEKPKDDDAEATTSG